MPVSGDLDDLEWEAGKSAGHTYRFNPPPHQTQKGLHDWPNATIAYRDMRGRMRRVWLDSVDYHWHTTDDMRDGVFSHMKRRKIDHQKRVTINTRTQIGRKPHGKVRSIFGFPFNQQLLATANVQRLTKRISYCNNVRIFGVDIFDWRNFWTPIGANAFTFSYEVLKYFDSSDCWVEIDYSSFDHRVNNFENTTADLIEMELLGLWTYADCWEGRSLERLLHLQY